MSNRIVLYGAPTSLAFTFDVFDEEGNLITSYPSIEIPVSTGRYYVDLPGSLTPGIYDVLVNFQGDYIGERHVHWDGTNILDENAIVASAVWSDSMMNYVTPGTMGYAQGKISAIESLITTLLKYETNRTRVDKNAFTLTVYDDNGTTPLKVFNLKDFTGASSYTEIAERDPV
jgi:hypothetical protein